jgi:hypothetical protein
MLQPINVPAESNNLQAWSPVYSHENKRRTQVATRGEVPVHSISFALIRARKTVRGLSSNLTEQERRAVARAVIDELKRHGDQLAACGRS